MKGNVSEKIIRILFPTASHYGIHYLFTFIVVLNSLLLTSFGAQTLNRYLFQFWAKMLFWTMGRRVLVRNREYIATGKSYITVMNHSSMFDIPAVMTFMPGGAWIGRDKLLRIPVFGSLLKKTNYIPIDPSDWRKSLAAIRQAADRATEGVTILIFPESTRTMDGKIQNFHRGFVKIMRDTGADILPITINGLFTWKSKYQKHINTTEPIEIIINKPIQAAELAPFSDAEIVSRVRKTVESSYNAVGGG